MTAPGMSSGWLRKATPFAVPVLVFGAAWAGVLQPRAAASRHAASELSRLEPKLQELAALPQVDTSQISRTTALDLTRHLPVADPVPDVLERLAHLALVPTEYGAIADLLIETGEPVNVAASPGAPRVADSSQPDPRLALFGLPIAYTPITVSFQGTYARLGQFLWDLRDLPALAELQSLDVRPAATSGETVRGTILLFAYRQVSTEPQRTTANQPSRRGARGAEGGA